MLGEDLGKPILVTFYDKSSGTIKNAAASVQKLSELKDHSDLLFQIPDGSQNLLAIDLRRSIRALEPALQDGPPGTAKRRVAQALRLFPTRVPVFFSSTREDRKALTGRIFVPRDTEQLARLIGGDR